MDSSIALFDMARKQRTFKIDERILEALDRVAQKKNASVNRYVENLLFSLMKQEGEIPLDELPLGESRGGRRVRQPKAGSTEKAKPTPDTDAD